MIREGVIRDGMGVGADYVGCGEKRCKWGLRGRGLIQVEQAIRNDHPVRADHFRAHTLHYTQRTQYMQAQFYDHSQTFAHMHVSTV